MSNPFKGMGGLGGNAGLMKLVEQTQKKMREDLEKMQERLDAARLEGSSGGGAVKTLVDGNGMLLEVTIAPEAVDPEDVETLQDMILTAVREALEKADTLRSDEQKKAMPNIPGITGMPGLF